MTESILTPFFAFSAINEVLPIDFVCVLCVKNIVKQFWITNSAILYTFACQAQKSSMFCLICIMATLCLLFFCGFLFSSYVSLKNATISSLACKMSVYCPIHA